MNKEKHFDKLQIKLTVIFTLLVFFISLILQISFFSYKYFHGIQIEFNKIKIISDVLSDKKLSPADINNLIKNEKRLGEVRKNNTNNDFLDQKGKILNYIILDSRNNIILQNIRGNIDIDIDGVNKILRSKDSGVKKVNNTIINYLQLEGQVDSYKVLLFKELNYDSSDYMSDIIKFLIAISLFSLLFFIIGFLFVKRNLEPVRKNMREMNHFIQDAGHELKTPIAVIDSNLQLMKQIGVYKEEMIEENLGEIKRLTKLIQALSELSDVENNTEIEKCSIHDEIQYIINEYDEIIKEKNINIIYKKSENFYIDSNKQYLFILLSNLIKNAIKFSNKKGDIYISYSDNIFEIQDFGCGIGIKNIDKIYNRFYQEKVERNGDGFGIGLSLVSKICQNYDWKINVESIEGKGTKFIVNF